MRISEASYDMTAQAFDRQPEKGDENLRVQFTNYPHFNQEKTNKEGRPIYDEVPYVTIIVPGQTDVVHRVAWAKDFRRFPRQWDAFQKNQNQDAAAGTPLKVVPWIQQNQCKELEHFNVFTVEQLANMPDSSTIRFMAIQKLKQLAKDFLQAAKEAAPLTAMRAELDDRDGKIAVMQTQLEAMKKQIDRLTEEEER